MKKIITAEINAHELAIRLFEKSMGVQRPPGRSTAQSWAEFVATEEEVASRYLAAAQAALEYFAECLNANGVSTAIN